jgi:hypothetical protein
MALIIVDAVWLAGTMVVVFLLFKTMRLVNVYRGIADERYQKLDRMVGLMADTWGPTATYNILRETYRFEDDPDPPKSVKPSEVKSALKDIKKVMEATE